MKTKLLVSAGLLAVLCAGGPAWAQDKDSQAFLKEAIQGNLAEQKLGQLAQQKGQMAHPSDLDTTYKEG